MAKSEIKHIDLSSLGSGASTPSKRTKSKKKMKSIGRKMSRKGVKGALAKSRKVRRGR
jgi:hypothetical protein